MTTTRGAVCTSLLCLSVIVVLGVSIVEYPQAQAEENARPTPALMTSDVVPLLGHEMTTEYHRLVSETLAEANSTDLATLKQHPNWGIALQAAWADWVDIRRDGRSTDSKQLHDGICRWLGFAEAKLGVAPPDSWMEFAKTARVRTSNTPSADGSGRVTPLLFNREFTQKSTLIEKLEGLVGPREVEVTRNGNLLRCRFKDNSECLIDLDKTDGVPFDDDKNFYDAALEIHQNDDLKYLILRPTYLSGYNMSAFRPGSANRSWSAYVENGNRCTSCIMADKFELSVKTTKDKLFLFGYCYCCLCVEERDIVTGKRTALFSSALW